MYSQRNYTVDILMATYNGEQHIEHQLLSLIGQTFRSWNLIVHDDGSNDDTVALIRKYADIDSRIRIIADDIKRLGPAANFLHLLQFSTSELVIFCDQDDVWLEDKLAELQKRHQQFDPALPLAVYGNGYAYSPGRGIFSSRITQVFPKELRDQLFLNAGIQGCSLMFNRALKEKLHTVPDFVAMHDHFITLGAISLGKLEYVDLPLMLYRQGHLHKVTANVKTSSLLAKITGLFSSDIPVVDRRHFQATKSFYQSYQDQLSLEQQKLFQAYFNYCKAKSIIKRLDIIFRHGFRIYDSTWLLAVKTFSRKAIN